jgi:hypothetical protein
MRLVAAGVQSYAGVGMRAMWRDGTLAGDRMRKLRLWTVFAAAGLCAVHADGLANPGDVAPASVEIGGAAPNSGAEAPAIPATPSSAAKPATAGNPLTVIPLSTLSATRDRPLFSSSRRPPPPPQAAAPPPPPPAPVAVKAAPPKPPPFTLLGTIIGGKIRMGVFRNDTEQAVTRIREGEADSGWTLRSVDPRSAVLEADGRMVTLDMPDPGSTPGVSPPPPPPRISQFFGKRRGALDNGDGL